MRMKIIFVLLQFFGCYAYSQHNVVINKFQESTNFTCVAVDENDQVWAGTKSMGLWKSIHENGKGPIGDFGRISTGTQFNTYNLQSMAVKTKKGVTSIWIGGNGLGGGTASGGGVYLFFASGSGSGIQYAAERNAIVAQGMGLSPQKNGGIPSRHSKAIAIDHNGGVWSAHSYHDLTVSGSFFPVYDPYTGTMISAGVKGGYYLTPGGLGFKPDGAMAFNNLSMDNMPYPAYTINTPLDKSAGTRTCVSVGCGPTETWMGFQTYPAEGGDTRFGGIARFDLAGNFLGYLDATNTPELPFTNSFSTPRPGAIHFTKDGTAWLGFNQNKGIAMLKNGVWTYVSSLSHYDPASQTNGTSLLLPNGIRMNFDAPNSIASSGDQVFIGTMDGLLVYKGKGDIAQDSSYMLITTADGLSSNIIKGLAASKKFIYAATEQGINEILIPSDVAVFHIADKNKPFEDTGGSNYKSLMNLTNRLGTNSAPDAIAPMFAADATTSSVFRYYTNDIDGFYVPDNYSFGIEEDLDQQDTILFGKLTLRPRNKYDEANPDYVDFIYRHPAHIDPASSTSGNPRYTFVIKDKLLDREIFKHDIEIALTPVLMIHGVWSSTGSFQAMEDHLREEGKYKPFQLLRIWKEEFDAAPENMFEEDADIIPGKILELINTCRYHSLSAGKVSVVAHSRGGLYTRAYISEVGSSQKYRDDIHCFITLNTPNSGSQHANLLLDERIVTYRPTALSAALPLLIGVSNVPVKVRDLAGAGVPASMDREGRNGAKVLKVHAGLIHDLNQPDKLNKFKEAKVPLHGVATGFKFCDFPVTACDLPSYISTPVKLLEKRLVYLKALMFLIDDVPSGVDGLVKYLLNGEDGDFIVPKSSMEAGLDDQYLSRFPGHNIPHSNIIVEGVTSTAVVHPKIVDLLKEDVRDPQSHFTPEGITPPRIHYKAFPILNDVPNNPAGNVNSRIAADEAVEFYLEKETVPGQITAGDSLKYKVHVSNVDYMFVMYEPVHNPGDMVYTEDRIDLSPVNSFAFKVPAEMYGPMNVYAYGVKDHKLVGFDSLRISIRIHDTLDLVRMYFENENEVFLPEKKTISFKVNGVFSDSLVRVINDFPGLNVTVRNTAIATKIGDGILQAEQMGGTSLVATYDNKLIDSIMIYVERNPNLEKTFLSDLSGWRNPTSGAVMIGWETTQEYQNIRFAVERKHENSDFDSIGFLPGNGTTYTVSNYSWPDNASSNEKVFYRLKFTSENGTVKYSEIIEVGKHEIINSLHKNEPSESNFYLSIVPNPSSSDAVTLHFEADNAEAGGVLSLYNLNGELVTEEQVKVSAGKNSFKVAYPENLSPGIYVLRVKTSTRTYTGKLVIVK